MRGQRLGSASRVQGQRSHRVYVRIRTRTPGPSPSYFLEELPLGSPNPGVCFFLIVKIFESTQTRGNRGSPASPGLSSSVTSMSATPASSLLSSVSSEIAQCKPFTSSSLTPHSSAGTPKYMVATFQLCLFSTSLSLDVRTLSSGKVD